MHCPKNFPQNNFVLAPCAHPRDLVARFSGSVPPSSAFSGDDEPLEALPQSKVDMLAAAQREDDNRLRDEDEQRRVQKR